MDDFTSSLYLGLRHPSQDLPPWQSLTTGVPATVREPLENLLLAQKVAHMQGLEQGIVAPSSLHLFWDVLGKLAPGTLVLADEKVYQIAQWGLESAVSQGTAVRYFKHHNPSSLHQRLGAQTSFRQLVVVTDGWCPHCGRAAPLPAYLAVLRQHKGALLVDDTQALGILGAHPSRAMPFGTGGGGLLKWYGVQGHDIITICSLAKGFGVPLAVLSASRNRIRAFKHVSDTRIHCSPASAAHVAAGLSALQENERNGGSLRLKLLQRTSLFRQLLQLKGLKPKGRFFPMQTLHLQNNAETESVYQQLRGQGIYTLLLAPHQPGGNVGLGICLSVSHTPSQITRLASTLFKLTKGIHQMV
ncbi:aminotransferase class I/II-fold pyridoxal phosphate-dependent enzyme [Pontibacter sp. CAU 1760]